MYSFKNWLKPPAFEGDVEKTITASLLNSILLTILIAPIIFSISAIITQENPTRSLTINLSALLFMSSLLFPLHKGYIKQAVVGTIIVMFTIFTMVASMHSGAKSPVLNGYILVVMMAGLLLGKRSAFITAFLGACTGLLLQILNSAELIPFENSLQLPEISTWIILSVFLGISAVFVGMSRAMTNQVLKEAEQHLIEQQEAQDALRASEGTVRALLEALPDIIFRIDRFGTFVDYIPAKDFDTLVPPEEFLGKMLAEVLPPELAEITQYYIARALDENLVQTYEYSLPSEDGLRYFESRMVKTDSDTVLAIVRDVTIRIYTKQKNEEMLAILERRNTQLRIAADVAKTCSSILDPDLLAQQAVDLIQRGFELYFVGLYLVDTASQAAILIAGSGEAGKNMLADGHHLHLEEPSMIAWCIRNGKARIAQAADVDKVRYPNPHLPDTRSELALPLISRGRVIGALTVQNTQENAFSEFDISSLQTMADQLGTAVENANLFEAAQKEIEVRQLVEKELEQERDFAVQMMNTLGQGVFVTDQKNRFEYVNPAFAKMLGRKPNDLIGKTVIEFANPEDVNKLDKGRARCFKGVVSSYEARFQNANGDDLHTLITGAPRYQDECITGSIVAITDLTEQKRAQAEREMLLSQMKEKNDELERSAREMETLRQSAAIVASTLDQEQTINLILEQLERVVPYTSASVQLINDNELEIVGGCRVPEDSGTIGTRYPINEDTPDLAVIQGREPYILFDDIQASYAQFQYPPHNYIHSWIAVPLKIKDRVLGIITVDGDQVGQFTPKDAQLVSVFADQVAIALENARLFGETEQRANQLAVLNEVSRTISKLTDLDTVMETIFEQAQKSLPVDFCFIGLYDEDTNMLSFPLMYDAGQRCEQHPRPVTDESFSGQAIKTHEPLLINQWADIIADDAEMPTLLGVDEKITESMMFAPLISGDQVVGVISVQSYLIGIYNQDDLNLLVGLANQAAIALENARLYSALQSELAVSEELVNELENKNAELERFTYTVSHDLKSPLITIRGFLGYLEQDAIEGNFERLKNDIERISNAAGKMGRLLDDLLELSRIGRLMNEPEEVPFKTVIREALSLVEGQLKDGNIKVKVGSKFPKVYVDRVRLVEVIQNLVDNAAKFVKDQPNPEIEIGVRNQGKGQIFYVKDNGIGIDPQYHEKIFGLFDKLDPDSEGTGVGLSLVKRIVEVHGGRIWVESEAGKGATFCFTLADKSQLEVSK